MLSTVFFFLIGRLSFFGPNLRGENEKGNFIVVLGYLSIFYITITFNFIARM